MIPSASNLIGIFGYNFPNSIMNGSDGDGDISGDKEHDNSTNILSSGDWIERLPASGFPKNSDRLSYSETLPLSNDTTIELDLISITSIPIQFREMSHNSRHAVILYTCLFIIAVFGNLSVFYSVLRQIFKFRVKTRITLLILHLSIADLIVTFFLIPMEVFWRISIQWYGGNGLCKLCQFFRAFGLYLSSMVIICISLDRYFAVIHPLRVINGKRMVKYMLGMAWLIAMLSSLPQSFIFSVKSHPIYPFQNCVSIGYFKTQEEEIVYNVFSIVVMYFAPLVVIIATYSLILKKINQKTKEHQEVLEFVNESLRSSIQHATIDYRRASPVYADEQHIMLQPGGNSQQVDRGPSYTDSINASTKPIPQKPMLRLRRSDNGGSHIMRARNRTVRLTLVIVMAFVFCSTPYIFMVLWYMFDREGAEKVEERLQDIFFMMAVANSCVNPLIYGTYSKGCNLICGCGFITSYFRKKSQRRSQQSRSEGMTGITAVMITRRSTIVSNGNAQHETLHPHHMHCKNHFPSQNERSFSHKSNQQRPTG